MKEIRKSRLLLTLGIVMAFAAMSFSPVLAQTIPPAGAQWQPFYYGSPHYYGEDGPKGIQTATAGWWFDHKNYAGKVFVWNDETNLYIYIDTNQPSATDFGLREVHIDVKGDPDDFPTTGSGNPKVGKFAYKFENLAGAQDLLVTIPLAGLPADPLAIAVHAELTNCETAWANCGGPGAFFMGNNWATFFWYTVE